MDESLNMFSTLESDYERILFFEDNFFLLDIVKFLYKNDHKFVVSVNPLQSIDRLISLRNKSLLENTVYVSPSTKIALSKIKERVGALDEDSFECFVLLLELRKYFVQNNILHMIADFRHFNAKDFLEIVSRFTASCACDLSFSGISSPTGDFIEYICYTCSEPTFEITFEMLLEFADIVSNTKKLPYVSMNDEIFLLLRDVVYRYPKEIKNSLVLIMTRRANHRI